MSLTSANAVIQLSIPGLYPIPQQLQGFAADDIFDTDVIRSVETLMGVDGVLSAGFVYVEIVQNFAVQADSPSAALFDNLYAAEVAAQDVYAIYGVILLSGIATKWQMSNGYMTGYKPLPDAKKLLQPRRFTITWNQISPAPV